MKHVQHYEANKAVFDAWIDCNSKLQISADIFQPLIEPFKKEFPSVNLVGCPECLIDMLRWVKSEWKKTQTKSKK
jgi:hypothetical protein